MAEFAFPYLNHAQMEPLACTVDLQPDACQLYYASQMPGVRLFFMQSSGGLTDAHAFQGKDAILSGPAGGVIGMASLLLDSGLSSRQCDMAKVIVSSGESSSTTVSVAVYSPTFA